MTCSTSKWKIRIIAKASAFQVPDSFHSARISQSVFQSTLIPKTLFQRRCHSQLCLVQHTMGSLRFRELNTFKVPENSGQKMYLTISFLNCLKLLGRALFTPKNTFKSLRNRIPYNSFLRNTATCQTILEVISIERDCHFKLPLFFMLKI